MKKVVIILEDGFEEIEAITPIDVLRRAGCQVVVAGIGKKEIAGYHSARIVADSLFSDLKDLPEAIVIPGGPGAEKLGQNKSLLSFIERMHKAGKVIAAICAAPAAVLSKTSVLDGKKATCYTGCEKDFGKTTTFVKDRVVVDGQVITSRGPGTALEFSYALVEKLIDKQTALTLADRMIAR